MSTGRGMDDEDVVCIYTHNGILFRHKKECSFTMCKDMNGNKDCHTLWLQSEREKQIYNIAYMWNIGKWCGWTYFVK